MHMMYDIPFICVLILLATSATSSTAFFVTTPECGAAFYTRSGTFSSPFYNTPNATRNSSETCEWRITAASDEKIILNISNIDIFKTPNCQQGSIEIRDGYWYSSPLLAKLCGYGRLDPVTSTGNKMYISYHYNNPQGHRGFIANYEAICGGDLFVENSTQLTTPNYPGKYPLNKKCIWRIVVPDYRLAVLTFHSFDVEDQNNCLYDYVEIRDGLDENGRLIDVFCGPRSGLNSPPTQIISNSSLPTQIISNSSYLYVKFVSDMSVQKLGFLATVQNDYDECLTEENVCAQICVNTIGSFKCACRPGYELNVNGRDCDLACGGTLNGTNGTIQSPSYPDYYPVNRTCTWDIIAERNNLIEIKFLVFDIQNGTNNDTECNTDSLKIYSNNNNGTTLEANYCGSVIPPPFLSHNNALRLVFNSDSSIQRTGFLLDYSTGLDLCTVNNGNCLHGCNSSMEEAVCQCLSNYTHVQNNRDCAKGNCLFEIASPNGVVKSPNYPANYDNYEYCEWSFRTTPGHRLRLIFQTFKLENQTYCSYDNLTVYDGLTVNSNKVIGEYCGANVPPAVTSSRNELFMVFKSDSSNVYKGFLANYSTVCGGQLEATDREKYIYSHSDFGYGDYSNGANCDWVITAQSGYVVSVKFLTFELANCNDYVEILDGSSSNSTSIGRFCGSNVPPTLASSNNVVTIRFQSDETGTGKGFILAYRSMRNETTIIPNEV